MRMQRGVGFAGRRSGGADDPTRRVMVVVASDSLERRRGAGRRSTTAPWNLSSLSLWKASAPPPVTSSTSARESHLCHPLRPSPWKALSPPPVRSSSLPEEARRSQPFAYGVRVYHLGGGNRGVGVFGAAIQGTRDALHGLLGGAAMAIDLLLGGAVMINVLGGAPAANDLLSAGAAGIFLGGGTLDFLRGGDLHACESQAT